MGIGRPALVDPAFWRRLDHRIAQALRRRGSAVRGLLQAVTTSTKGPLGLFLGRAGEPAVQVEIAEIFGFTSAPPANVEAIAVPVGGSTAHLVIVGQIDRGYRPVDLAAGETRIYCALAGTHIKIKADGTIEVGTPSGGKVLLDAAGQVVMNNGTLGVARLTDTCIPSAVMTAWFTAVAASPAAVPAPVGTLFTIGTASATVKAG